MKYLNPFLIVLILSVLSSCGQKKQVVESEQYLPLFAPYLDKHKETDLEMKIKYFEYFSKGNEVYLRRSMDVGGARSIIVYSYHKLEGATIGSFEEFDGTLFAKDSSLVFYDSFKIEEADAKSFQIFSPDCTKQNREVFFAKDKSSAFFKDSKIQNADTESFIPISSYYSKDKNNVYYKCCQIEADLNTFEAVDRGGERDFGYDKDFLYFKDEKIKTSGPPYYVGSGQVFHDKNSIYTLYSSITKEDKLLKIKEALKDIHDQYYWKQQIRKVIIKVKDSDREEELRTIIEDSEKQLHQQNFSLAEGNYKLEDNKIRLQIDDYKTEYNIDVDGNLFILSEDATLKYREMFPEANITGVMVERFLDIVY